jgi:hypothetical protein
MSIKIVLMDNVLKSQAQGSYTELSLAAAVTQVTYAGKPFGSRPYQLDSRNRLLRLLLLFAMGIMVFATMPCLQSSTAIYGSIVLAGYSLSLGNQSGASGTEDAFFFLLVGMEEKLGRLIPQVYVSRRQVDAQHVLARPFPFE